MLARRADAVDVIGAALVANPHGQGRPIAEQLGRPADTCAAGYAGFGDESRRPLLTRCAARTGSTRAGSDPAAGTTAATQTALAAPAFAVETVEDFLGSSREGRWAPVSLLCSGRLLANTNCPYPVLR